jgi:hypothetical protein
MTKKTNKCNINRLKEIKGIVRIIIGRRTPVCNTGAKLQQTHRE